MIAFRIFDNGGRSLDRYTLVFNTPYNHEPDMFHAVVAGAGVYMHSCAQLDSFLSGGEHLGKEITLNDLDSDLRQQFVGEIEADRAIIDPTDHQDCTIQVYDVSFYLNDSNGEDVTHPDGTLATFTAPNLDMSHIAEYPSLDDLEMIK
jgi:hypothetical protein